MTSKGLLLAMVIAAIAGFAVWLFYKLPPRAALASLIVLGILCWLVLTPGLIECLATHGPACWSNLDLQPK